MQRQPDPLFFQKPIPKSRIKVQINPNHEVRIVENGEEIQCDLDQLTTTSLYVMNIGGKELMENILDVFRFTTSEFDFNLVVFVIDSMAVKFKKVPLIDQFLTTMYFLMRNEEIQKEKYGNQFGKEYLLIALYEVMTKQLRPIEASTDIKYLSSEKICQKMERTLKWFRNKA